MDEQEWAACDDPTEMLRYLYRSGKVCERKVRLFAAACCRRVWNELCDERSRRAVIVAERHADSLATAEDLDVAADAAWAVCQEDRERAAAGGQIMAKWGYPVPSSAAAYNVALPVGWWGGAPAFVAPYLFILKAAPDPQAEGQGQCGILRDLFGPLPFRRVALADSVLRWHGGLVRRLAEAAYENRLLPSGQLDPERLAVLADALEEAGADAEMVAHLRGPGPHVRGCAVVDLLTSRE